MGARNRNRNRNRIGAVLVACAAGGLFLAALASGSGPSRPTSVTPAEGAAVAIGPSEVSLMFTAGQPPTAVHLGVTGPDGRSVTRGPERLTAEVATVPVMLAQAGEYRIAFHVVLADGSEVLGDSRFRVGDPDPSTVGTSTVGTSTVGPSTVETQGAPAHSHISDDPLNIAFLAVDLVLLIALAVLFRPRRRRRVDDERASHG